jgi:hypothetical protein
MNSATTSAGPTAPRTTRDEPLAKNSTDDPPTTCDGCNNYPAVGINADGRSLCRACARRAETLVPDGGDADE